VHSYGTASTKEGITARLSVVLSRSHFRLTQRIRGTVPLFFVKNYRSSKKAPAIRLGLSLFVFLIALCSHRPQLGFDQ